MPVIDLRWMMSVGADVGGPLPVQFPQDMSYLLEYSISIHESGMHWLEIVVRSFHYYYYYLLLGRAGGGGATFRAQGQGQRQTVTGESSTSILFWLPQYKAGPIHVLPWEFLEDFSSGSAGRRLLTPRLLSYRIADLSASNNARYSG